MDFSNQSVIYNFKLEDIGDFKFQSVIHPFILSSAGAYNVFYPKPLVSQHFPESHSTMASGVPIDSMSYVTTNWQKGVDAESIATWEKKLEDISFDEDYILDYIPEYKICLHWQRNDTTKRNFVTVSKLGSAGA